MSSRTDSDTKPHRTHPDAERTAHAASGEARPSIYSPHDETEPAHAQNHGHALVDDFEHTADNVYVMKSSESNVDLARKVVGANGEVASGQLESDNASSTGSQQRQLELQEDERREEGNSCVRAVSRFFNLIIPKGGILSGALNMASVTFGAGVMSFPAAFNTAGMVMAVIYLVVVTAFTIFSITLLSIVADKTNLWTFEALARNLFGRGADVFVAIIMWLLCFGGAIGYVVAVGDIFTAIFNDRPNTPEFLKSASGRRCLQSAVWLFFMLPVSMPKRVNSLRYISALGVSFVVFFVFCVVGHSAQHAFKHGVRSDIVLFRTGNSAVSAVSIFIFGYLCQVNAISIHRESIPRSVHRMTLSALLSCGVCGTLYFLIGFFGYAEFGPELTGNILSYYNAFKTPIFFVCYGGLIIKLIASFSQNMFACRRALFQVLHWDVDTMPYWKHSIFAGIFAVGALILGLFVPDINIVFGLVGAFCGGFIGFVFPALFVMYSGNWTLKSVGVVHYLATYVLLIAGVVGICFGTIATTYSTIEKYN